MRACLALAEALGLATVAEGVETADQAAWLARSGCDQVQGYFYSRPLEPADAEAFLVAESLRVGQEPLSRSSSSWTSTTAIPIVASEIP